MSVLVDGGIFFLGISGVYIFLKIGVNSIRYLK